MTKLNYQQAKFMLSVANMKQLPPEQGLEVAFAGRSNAGKSSALNALTQQKSLAKTSKTPGRTQLINFFEINNQCRLVDLPGYGYAKVSQEIKLRWQRTLGEYLENRKCLQGLVLIMDIRHPLKEYDINMIDWGNHCNLPMHLVLTKADKLSRSAQQKTIFQVERALKDLALDASLQVFSATRKQGVEQLRSKLDEWFSF